MLSDIQFAVRVLRKSPGFTAIAVVSLALGIGANSAMFSLADALLLRPLPVPDAEQVVTICDTAPDLPIGALGNLSYPDYVDLRDKSKSFSGLFAGVYTSVGMAEQPDALPQLKLGMAVTGNFFQVLELKPAIGRTFSAEEDRVPGRDAVAVLAYDTWDKHFGGDSGILGRRIRLNGVEFTIIGVAPKTFAGIYPVVHPELYIPMMMLPKVQPADRSDPLTHRGDRGLTVKGRLKPGVTLAQANAEVTTVASALAAAYPATNRLHGMMARSEIQARVAQSPPNAAFAAMLLAVAGLVLIIACANVANLSLSRSQSRAREMAVRLAIGASRRRLIRQLLTESLVLSVAGAALGLFAALYSADYFNRLRFAGDLPVSLIVQLDHRVLIFSLVVAVLSALVFGLVPAIRSAQTNLVPALKSGEAAGRRTRTFGRNALVIAQVALSLTMLSAAALFVRSLREIVRSNPGFRTDHILLMSFDPSLAHYSNDRTRAFYRTLSERALQMPGVKNASLSVTVPFDGASLVSHRIAPEGYQFPKDRESDAVFCNLVDDRYFDTMGTPLVKGRAITAADTATAPAVAVINEFMAAHYWPHQDAIGKRFKIVDGETWVQVVGIARNSTYVSYGEPRLSFFYLSAAQQPPAHMTLLVQTASDPSALAEPMRNLVQSIDPHQPVYNVRTMREYYETQGLQAIRLVVKLVGGMGLLGLAMALIGLYGLVSYSVSRRTREIGIRVAIGAQRMDILRNVLRQGMTLAVIGVGFGYAASMGVIRLIYSLFGGLQDKPRFDFWTSVGVPLALLAVTLLASYIPARRAATVDPNKALRYE